MIHAPVGVVIVNYWHDAHDTLCALDSLVSAQPSPLRVAVVDNGSRDSSLARLQQWIDDTGTGDRVSLLALPGNTGFAGGNNAGLELLARDTELAAFLLLNNDATVERSFFAELEIAMHTRPDAALYGATIYHADGRTVWYAGGAEQPLRALVLHQTELPASNDPRDTEFVTGCAMVIPRTTLARMGGLCEAYFPGYWEDAEYSVRARRLGPLVYAPGAIAYHKVGTSMGIARVSPRVAYLENRHRALFVRRNYEGLTRAVALTYLLATKPLRMLRESLAGNPRVGWAILRGAMAGIFAGEARRPDVATATPGRR